MFDSKEQYYQYIIKNQQATIEQLKTKYLLAKEDLMENTKCCICKNLPEDGNMTHCPNYSLCGLSYAHFVWRGED